MNVGIRAHQLLSPIIANYSIPCKWTIGVLEFVSSAHLSLFLRWILPLWLYLGACKRNYITWISLSIFYNIQLVYRSLVCTTCCFLLPAVSALRCLMLLCVACCCSLLLSVVFCCLVLHEFCCQVLLSVAYCFLLFFFAVPCCCLLHVACCCSLLPGDACHCFLLSSAARCYSQCCMLAIADYCLLLLTVAFCFLVLLAVYLWSFCMVMVMQGLHELAKSYYKHATREQ